MNKTPAVDRLLSSIKPMFMRDKSNLWAYFFSACLPDRFNSLMTPVLDTSKAMNILMELQQECINNDYNYNYNIFVDELYGRNFMEITEYFDSILGKGLLLGLTVGRHSVVITGSSIRCDKNNNCRKMWLVRNSWGKTGSGWYDSQKLYKAINSDKNSIATYIKNCDPTSESIFQEHDAIDFTEKCEFDKIIGKLQAHYLFEVRYTEGFKNLFRSMLDATDIYGDAVVHYAVMTSDFEVIKDLKEAGANLNLKDKRGNAPIHLAVENGDRDVIDALVWQGANVDEPNKKLLSPLFLAVIRSNSKIVKELIQLGAKINLKALNSYTPLHWAVLRENIELVQILIEGGASLTERDDNDATPLDIAIEKENTQILNILSKYAIK